MAVYQFPGRPRSPATEGGVTHEQAMEMFRRYFEQSQAVPTIAHEMGVDYEVSCAVIAGRHWPGVRQHWMDRVLP